MAGKNSIDEVVDSPQINPRNEQEVNVVIFALTFRCNLSKSCSTQRVGKIVYFRNHVIKR